MSRHGVRALEAAKFDDYQDTVKRICRDVTSVKNAVSEMDEKYVAMFSGIEKKQDAIMQYLCKLESSLTPISSAVFDQTKCIQTLMQNDTQTEVDVESLKEKLVMMQLKCQQGCLVLKSHVDWDIFISKLGLVHELPSNLKLELIDAAIRRRDNIIRNFYYKSVKSFYEEYVKDVSNGGNDSYRTSLFTDYVLAVRKTSKKGKKYADCVTDSDFMALVCKPQL